MRILFLMTQDMNSPAGVGRYGPLARELVRRGHQVRIATLHSDFDALEEHQQILDGVEVHYVSPMHVKKRGNLKSYYPPHQLAFVVLRSTLALSWAALKFPSDIIFVGKPHPMNSIAGLLAKFILRVPMVVDCDDYETGLGHFSGRWQKNIIEFFEKRVPRMANAVTTHTHFMINNLISWGVPPEKITYLQNGVDPERFTITNTAKVEQKRKELKISGKKVVAYIGSLSLPGHPIDLLINAFAILQRDIPDSVLLIVGGGEDIESLQNQAADLGLKETCIFIGRVPPEDIPIYYALANVSTDPVHDDPAARGRSPLKLFESWKSGVPFVSADVGERSYLLGDPRAGLLVAPDNEEAFANGISKVLLDQDLANKVAVRGKARSKNYYWSTLVLTLEDLFNTHFNINQKG